MKNIIKKAVLSLILVLSMTISTFAQNKDVIANAGQLDTYLQESISTDYVSRVTGTARGRLLSSASLQISNDGDGILGVYADTLCHSGMSKIYMVIYLDVWDESLQDWMMVDRYEYTWLAADYPDRDLTDVSVSFDVVGLQKGRTYSLRGYHSALSFDNLSEAMSTETNGIILE